MTLLQAITDARGDLALLRRHGASIPIEAVEAIVQGIADAAEAFTTYYSEIDAMIASGHTVPWFRQRFAAWERQGLARRGTGGKREYLECIVPRRLDLDAIRADAERTARGGEEAA